MTSPVRRSLSVEARRAIWDRLWQRLLQPLPSEIVSSDEQTPPPDKIAEQRLDKAVGR